MKLRPDAARVRELLDYDPKTGVFIWRARSLDTFATVAAGKRWLKVHVGKPAGGRQKDGYIQIWVDGVRYLAHHLAWLYVHGRWPVALLDHENEDKADNAIGNLREATHAQNMQARGRPVSNTSGVKGVSWAKRSEKWRACIRVNGQIKWLGEFHDIGAAAQAYANAAREYHGEFARLE